MTDQTAEAVTHPLLDRLRSATCGSRELDCLIHEWECPAHTIAMRGMYYGEPTGEYYEPEPDRPGGYLVAQAPRFTSSLDAALGLVERALPGWAWLLASPDPMQPASAFYACLADKDDNGATESWNVERAVFDAHAPTAPLAVLIALLTALASKEAPNE